MQLTKRGIDRARVFVAPLLVGACVIGEHPAWQGEGGESASASSEGMETGTTETTTDSGTETGTTATDSTDTGETDTGDEPGNVIFATSTTYAGMFASPTEADAACQARADTAALGGIWTAHLSWTGETALSRIDITGPVTNRAGELIAEDAAGFWSTVHLAGIALDEFGDPVGHDVWTGSRTSGDLANSNCGDWLDLGAKGMIGDPQTMNSSWSERAPEDCTSEYGLYCVSD